MAFADLRFTAYLAGSNFALSLPGHRFRIWWLRRVSGFAVGVETAVERRARVTSHGHVSIGSHTNINRGVTLDGRGGLQIGSRVNISEEVMLLTADHDPVSPIFAGRTRATVIGDRVWIATRALVLPGARIGDGALIAAGAVVHGAVAPGSIVAGNPARQIGVRPLDAQNQLPRYARTFH